MTELICVICPKGCHLKVDEENGYQVTNFGCSRGEAYGRKELTDPTRVLTSVVCIKCAAHPCCPVKTSGAVPKARIREVMDLLKNVRLSAPKNIGDVVVPDVCGIGVDWVVTKEIQQRINNDETGI
ncbi:MAG: DUF1667 domain-containing protein [Oscillospiraceae bacterium]